MNLTFVNRWETTLDGEPMKSVPNGWIDDGGKGPPTSGIFQSGLVRNEYSCRDPDLHMQRELCAVYLSWGRDE